MRYVYHMQQAIRLAHFIERALEALYQMVRQLADKANGIAQQERRLLVHHFPRSRVQGSEELVLGEDLALAEDIHQGALAHIRIAY
jgi:hypothetical protein